MLFRPFRHCLAALALVFAIFSPLAASERLSALDLLDVETDYAADYYLRIQGRGIYKGTVVHAPGQERRAFDTVKGQQVALIRRDLDAVSMLWPQNKNFLSLPFSSLSHYIGGDLRTLMIEREKAGVETVNGEQCARYRVSTQSGENSFTGHMWFTKDGILMKAVGTARIDGKNSLVETALSGLIRTKSDPILFDIPADYWGIPLRAGAIELFKR